MENEPSLSDPAGARTRSPSLNLPVPADLPVIDDELSQQIQTAPMYKTTKEKATDFDAAARDYFERKAVVEKMDALLTELFLAEPDDPIDHMMKFLLRHPTLTEITEHQGREVDPDAALAYSNRFKLPHLFDEMLTALLNDLPENPPLHAMSWLRWNKNGFIVRHVPEGYRAYYAAKNSEKRNGSAESS